jgi:two-component system phosphate regulon sensor histidine kinase PhoR
MSQELLDLASIESGKVELQLHATSPRHLLETAAERMRVQAERAGLSLVVDCAESVPPALADESRVGQVLANLVHNATKFTPPGGRIVLSARPDLDTGLPVAGPRAILFSVTDTGRGITADDLPRIFERFYRADRARSKGGTGLGLSIARHIVESHGGRIWAESVEGSGSTFSFTIPEAD